MSNKFAPLLKNSRIYDLTLEASALKNSWADLTGDIIFKIKTINTLNDVYSESEDLEPPEFVYCDSPKHAVKLIWERKKSDAIKEGDPISPVLKKSYIDTILNESTIINIDGQRVYIFPYEGICYIVEQPVAITISVEYQDGWKETYS